MTFFSLFLIPAMTLVSAPAFAEQGDLPRIIKRADGGAAGSNGGGNNNGFGMSAEESAAIFKLDSGPTGKTSQSLTDPSKSRSFAGDPELNTGAREAILKQCDPLREKSMEQFRACYQEGKNKELERVRRSFDRTNSGSNYRTAPGGQGNP